MNTRDFSGAVEDFRRARRRAALSEALSLLAGGQRTLLPYDEVRRRLRGVESSSRHLEEVELERIVGSVGRYNDFTRGFLPRQDADEGRWVAVRRAVESLEGVPPIEVYRIGDVYFVRDGNHRVSVARRLGMKYLQAYVTPVHVRVPYDPAMGPDELIVEEEHADFLLETRLDEHRPGADLRLTAPGGYEVLLEHVRVHRYFMGLDEARDVDWDEAVGHWYDHVYEPVVRSIRRNGLLRGFEGRTETDLYLWLHEHRARLQEETGWQVPPETIADNVPLSGRMPRTTPESRDELLRSVREGRAPAELVARISDDLLVALPDAEASWCALDQALVVARREGARLYGLHVVDSEGEARKPEAARLRELFEGRCRDAGVHGQFGLAVGPVVPTLLERAVWADLVVACLVPAGGAARLSDGVRGLLRRSPRPLLAAARTPSALERPLLAFDGSPRAREALFAAAYVGAKWGVPVTVVTVQELGTPARALGDARVYLEGYGVETVGVEARGPVAARIVETAEAHRCDLILMGSYKHGRWLDRILGAGVPEEVLLASGCPVLVC